MKNIYDQPFMGSEVAGPGGKFLKDGSPAVTVVRGEDGFPVRQINYNPVSAEQVPAIDGNGVQLSPESRAFIAARMSLALQGTE